MSPLPAMPRLTPADVNGGFEMLHIGNEKDVQVLVLSVQKSADKLGFSQVGAIQLATAASELAMNIVKYARRGVVHWAGIRRLRREGMELWAIDSGPGIADLELAMQEHYSSKGTLGVGLPGTRRLVDEFWIESIPGEGTRVCIRKWR